MSTANDTRAKLLERIQKLLAMNTGTGATEAEAQTAAAFVSRLMAEHNISMADVETHRPEDMEWIESEIHAGRMGQDYGAIVRILQRFYFVEYYWQHRYQQGKTRRVAHLVLFGTSDNIEMAKFVFEFLVHTFRDLWVRYRVETGARANVRIDYYRGLAAGLTAKLAEERKQFEIQGNNKNALVLVGNALQKAFKESVPNLRHTSAPARSFNNAFHDGHQRGKKISIARPVAHGHRKSLEG